MTMTMWIQHLLACVYSDKAWTSR